MERYDDNLNGEYKDLSVALKNDSWSGMIKSGIQKIKKKTETTESSSMSDGGNDDDDD